MAVEVADVQDKYPTICAGVDDDTINLHIDFATETVDAACLRQPLYSTQNDAVDTAIVHQTAHTLDAGDIYDLHGYQDSLEVGEVTYQKPATLSPRALRVLQTAGLTVPYGG